ncbi:MAG: DUF554 family protein [Oscillospiraceae bacterium]|nr:DUF554 family protein [Oscillospiraceae bacterium]
MGIAVNAITIFFGGILGSSFKKFAELKNLAVLGISIMIISLVGFFESIFNITQMKLESQNLMIIVFSLLIGSVIGDALNIEVHMNRLSDCENTSYNAFVDATLFFGVGGLQICGPVLLALNRDNSQLLIKSVVDFPFALVFGAAYGKITALSAFPVAAMQLAIAAVAFFAAAFLTDAIICQLCAIGYIILFFSGFNLICERKNKINNVNMLPGIFIILIINIIMKAMGVIG